MTEIERLEKVLRDGEVWLYRHDVGFKVVIVVTLVFGCIAATRTW